METYVHVLGFDKPFKISAEQIVLVNGMLNDDTELLTVKRDESTFVIPSRSILAMEQRPAPLGGVI